MSMHTDFADWYRAADIVPQDGVLAKRWAGVEAFAKMASSVNLLLLAKMFCAPEFAASDVPDGFAKAFRDSDENFPLRDNDNELRVLAGATIRQVIEKGWLARNAALILSCACFGSRKKTIGELSHLQAAEQKLLRVSRDLRDVDEVEPPATFEITKEELAEHFAAAVFNQNSLQVLHAPFLAAMDAILSKVSKATVEAGEAISALTQKVKVREEELNMLWWLHTGQSSEIGRPFSALGAATAAVILPLELEGITVFAPGAATTPAILLSALRVAANGDLPDLTVAEAVNAAPREIRIKLKDSVFRPQFAFVCPILFAMTKSLDTANDADWLPVYRNASDIDPAEKYLGVELAMQIYAERLLISALAD